MKKNIAVKALVWLVMAGVLCSYSETACGQSTITVYGNNAGFGVDNVNSFTVDTTAGTGVFLNNYMPSNGNGRGVVVVGNVMFTTVTDDPKIYKTDVNTKASLGTITTGQASLSTLAWDGSTFWTTDYSGTNRGFQIDINGNTIKTVSFANAGGGMDGMEWFNNKLIVNRGDAVGIYDVYDLNGNLLTANFINTGGASGTGIAFDGTNFLVSHSFNSLDVFDGTTGAFIKNIPLTGAATLIEDLSVDYAARADTGGLPAAAGLAITVLGPFTNPTIILTDREAIFSAIFSGIPTGLAQREILLNLTRTATRDFDARLFRLHDGSMFADLPTGAPGPTGNELIKRGTDGKILDAGKDYKVATPEEFKRFQLFGAGDFNAYDVDDNGPQRGFESDTYAGSVGMEYKLTRHIVLGLGASYIESNTEISRSLGGTDIRGTSFSAYGSTAWRQCYFDLLYSYGVFDDQISRKTLLGRTARGDTESRNHSVVFNTGYNFELGRLRTGPLAAAEYIHGEFDGWDERGGGRAGLHFKGQQYDSLVSRVGWQASLPVPTKFGSITPQVRASWDRENLDDSESVAVTLLHSPITIIHGSSVKSGGKFSASEDTRKPGRDYLNVGAGLRAQFGERASIVLDYETHLLQDGASDHIGSLRIAFAF